MPDLRLDSPMPTSTPLWPQGLGDRPKCRGWAVHGGVCWGTQVWQGGSLEEKGWEGAVPLGTEPHRRQGSAVLLLLPCTLSAV